jgi:hypothetical protein
MDHREDTDSEPDYEALRANSSGNIFGRRLTPPFSAEPSNNEAAPSDSTLQGSATRSSAADDDGRSVLSQSSTAPDSPTSLRSTPFNFSASRPVAASSSSKQTRRTRFLDENVSILGDATLPQAEKDGDDPSTPEGNDGTSQHRDYTTPTAIARLLASRAAASGDSSAESYTLGNPNLVRPCKTPCR